MAISLSQLLHLVSGSYENIIIYQCKGQTRIRSKPKHIRNPRTSEQMLQRKRFDFAMHFYSSNQKSLIKHIWRLAARDMVMSGYNLFTSNNLKAFNKKGDIIDYSFLHITIGSLELPVNFRCELQEGRKVVFSWDLQQDILSQRLFDHLMMAWLVGNRTYHLNFCDKKLAFRKDGQATWEIPENVQKNLHLYCFFMQPDRQDFSVSKYFHIDTPTR